jgi:hypothetical protein
LDDIDVGDMRNPVVAMGIAWKNLSRKKKNISTCASSI